MRYVTRTSALEYEDFNSAKSRLIELAEKFGEISHKARKIIAMLSQDFIFYGCTILVHGFSGVVLEVLKTAALNRKLFRVLCIADGVVESGGIINMMVTYQIALAANSMNKPVYVAAESYKFARLYPLDQKIWHLPSVQSILEFLSRPRLKLKHLLGIILLPSISNIAIYRLGSFNAFCSE